MRRTTTSSSQAAHVRGCGPPSIHITTPMSARSSDTPSQTVMPARRSPSLWACRRSPNAGAGTLTGVTSTGLDAQRTGPLEEFLGGGHPGGRKDPLGASPCQLRGETGRAIELPPLLAAAEEPLNLPPSEILEAAPVHVSRTARIPSAPTRARPAR